MTTQGSIKQRLIRGGAWAFGSRILLMLAMLLTNVILSRLLSPADMGSYFLLLSLVTLMAVAAKMGLDQASLRLVSESLGKGDNARVKGVVRQVLSIGGLGAFLAAGVFHLGLGRFLMEDIFDSPLGSLALGFGALWIVVLAFRELLTETFRGFHDIRFASVFGGMCSALFTAIIFAAIWAVRGNAVLEAVVGLSVAAGAFCVFLSGWKLNKKYSGLGPGRRNVHVKHLFTISFPLFVNAIIAFIFMNSSLWIIGAYMPQEKVAVYAMAYRLVTLLIMSLTLVNAVVPPIIAELYVQGKKEKLERVLRSTATLAAAPAVVVLLVYALFGGWILEILFGPFYRQGWAVLALLSIAQFITTWVGPCNYTLIMTGHQNDILWITIMSAVIGIVGGIAAAPVLGIVGVAFATAFAIICRDLLANYMVYRRHGMWTHASLGLLPEIGGVFRAYVTGK